MTTLLGLVTELGQLFGFGRGKELNALEESQRQSEMQRMQQERQMRDMVYSYYASNPNQVPPVQSARQTEQGIQQLGALFPGQLEQQGAQTTAMNIANQNAQRALSRQELTDQTMMIDGQPAEGIVGRNQGYLSQEQLGGVERAKADAERLGGMVPGLAETMGTQAPSFQTLEGAQGAAGLLQQQFGVGQVKEQNKIAGQRNAVDAATAGAGVTWGESQQPFLNVLLQQAGGQVQPAAPVKNPWEAVGQLMQQRQQQTAPPQAPPAPRPKEVPQGWPTRPQALQGTPGRLADFMPQQQGPDIWSMLMQPNRAQDQSMALLNQYLRGVR